MWILCYGDHEDTASVWFIQRSFIQCKVIVIATFYPKRHQNKDGIINISFHFVRWDFYFFLAESAETCFTSVLYIYIYFFPYKENVKPRTGLFLWARDIKATQMLSVTFATSWSFLMLQKNPTSPFCLKFTFFSSCPSLVHVYFSPLPPHPSLLTNAWYDKHPLTLCPCLTLHLSVFTALTHTLAWGKATKHALAYTQLSTSKASSKTASRANKWA